MRVSQGAGATPGRETDCEAATASGIGLGAITFVSFWLLFHVFICSQSTLPPLQLRDMALPETSQAFAPPSPAESAPAPRRTALPSKPIPSKEPGDVSQADQEQPGASAGTSPTMSHASTAPSSPTSRKAGGSSSQTKTTSAGNTGQSGQVCRCVDGLRELSTRF